MKHLSPSRVVSAARALAGAAPQTFADFLILKRYGIDAGSSKPTRVPDLDVPVEEFMGVKSSRGEPLIPNRANLSVLKRRDNWVHDGYARSGTYTNLDRGSLGRVVEFSPLGPGEEGRRLRFKTAYMQLVPQQLLKRGPLPLVELSIWACRRDDFEDGAMLPSVIDRFVAHYNITPAERATFFREPSAIVGESGLFAPGPFDADALAAALLQAYPPSSPAGQTEGPGSDTDDEPVGDEFLIKADDPRLSDVRALLFEDGFGGVILTGAPGTGKTWYARQIALRLANGDTSRIREIQFHPSYQYEDFVEGYAPVGPGNYEIVGKHLVQMCALAEQTTEPIILVIDEFSRSDPVRIMGEALTYMEGTARDKRFYLASGRPMTIPRNLYFLATMNPEDRSVDELDAAMERRWAKVHLDPDPKLVNQFLKDNAMNRPSRRPVVEFFQALQEHSSIGHAYFRGVRDIPSLKRLWDNQLVHVLRKQHRYSPDILERTQAQFQAAVAKLGSLGGPDQPGNGSASPEGPSASSGSSEGSSDVAPSE